VAAEKPVAVEDEIGIGNHEVSMTQLPPFGGQVSMKVPEAIIPISLP
jgi:hypothetical protein